MTDAQRTVTVTVIEKPDCKLILKRGIAAKNYFEYSAEIGCDAFETLKTVSPTLDKVACVDLPLCLIKPNTSLVAAAVEVSADYSGEIPEGFEIIDLPAHLYMCFNGAPYDDENWCGKAHQELYKAIDNYKPELYGYEYIKDEAPVFNHFASAENGVRQIIPVRKIISR
jgi:hypothetical protein